MGDARRGGVLKGWRGGGVDTWKERGTFFTDLDLSVGCRDCAIGSPFVLGLDQLDRADWIPPPFFPGPRKRILSGLQIHHHRIHYTYFQ